MFSAFGGLLFIFYLLVPVFVAYFVIKLAIKNAVKELISEGHLRPRE